MDPLNVCCFFAAGWFLEKAYSYRHPLVGEWQTFWMAALGRPLCLLAILICLTVALALCLKGCDLSWTQVTSWLASR